ncbi:MAG TPA: hypothetical protein VD998_03550, partial [Verrucomicrobiae bacterium]|nr:hypothetical protein [Verrucomicrobiae bacterium]
FVVNLVQLGDRRYALTTPEGNREFRSRTKGTVILDDLFGAGLVNDDEHSTLTRRLGRAQLYYNETDPARFEMCPCPRNHGTLYVGFGEELEVHSRYQALALLDKNRNNETFQDQTAAREAIAASSLPEKTAQEEAQTAPARVQLDPDGSPVRNGVLYAAGTKPLARFFSQAKGFAVLCAAVDNRLIDKGLKSAIEEQIRALDLPVEITDVDRHHEHILKTRRVYIASELSNELLAGFDLGIPGDAEGEGLMASLSGLLETVGLDGLAGRARRRRDR